MINKNIDTNLNLEHIFYIFKRILNDVKSGKNFMDASMMDTTFSNKSCKIPSLNLRFDIITEDGLDSNYKPLKTKRLLIFLTNDFFRLFNCEIECLWETNIEIQKSKEIITVTEYDFKIKETTNEYTYGINIGIDKIENWFHNNFFKLERILRIEKIEKIIV